MKKTILLTIAGCICWLSQAVASDYLPKKIHKTVKETKAVFYEIGFANGVTCGIKVAMKQFEQLQNGFPMTEEQISHETALCKAETKERYQVR